MKYYLAVEKDSTRHIITAQSEENAKRVLRGSDITEDYIYELKEDTFDDEGFLMSDEKETAIESQILSNAYKKLVVMNNITGEEIAVITNEDTSVITANGDIVVKLTLSTN